MDEERKRGGFIRLGTLGPL